MSLANIEKAVFADHPLLRGALDIALLEVAKKIEAEDTGFPPPDQAHATPGVDKEWATAVLQGRQRPDMGLVVQHSLEHNDVGQNPLTATPNQYRQSINERIGYLRDSVLDAS